MSRLPGQVILVGGYPGAGKSTVIHHAVGQLCRAGVRAAQLAVLRTDTIRRELYPGRAYAPAQTPVVYAELNRRLAAALRRGCRYVFLDGVFVPEARAQEAAQTAATAGAVCAWCWLQASYRVRRARLRRAAGTDRYDSQLTAAQLRPRARPTCPWLTGPYRVLATGRRRPSQLAAELLAGWGPGGRV